MTLLSQTLEQAVAEADFSAIQQAVVELILQKDGHALSKELARRRDLSTFVSRLLPVLQSWNQAQLATAGLDRVVAQLEQFCVPAAISSFARFASDWYGIQGCRPCSDPVEIVVLTLDGQWMVQGVGDACFRYPSSRHAEGLLGTNYSFVGVFTVLNPRVLNRSGLMVHALHSLFKIFRMHYMSIKSMICCTSFSKHSSLWIVCPI